MRFRNIIWRVHADVWPMIDMLSILEAIGKWILPHANNISILSASVSILATVLISFTTNNVFSWQFVPEFEKECFEAWREKGVEPTNGLSALELFRLISLSITPHTKMIAAVQKLKQIGIILKEYVNGEYQKAHIILTGSTTGDEHVRKISKFPISSSMLLQPRCLQKSQLSFCAHNFPIICNAPYVCCFHLYLQIDILFLSFSKSTLLLSFD